MKSIIFISIVVVLCQQLAQAQLVNNKNYREHFFKEMRYGWYAPADYDAKKSYPLIVFLHGSRDTVSHDLQWYAHAFQRSNPCFVLTPKCGEPYQGWGNTWQRGHTLATTHTLALVDSLVKRYNIDRNRLYLYGISMGGFGVFSILSKEKGKFAAGYAVCGGSDVRAASSLLDTPLWIFHGEIDDVVPVALSRNIYNEMIKLGGKNVKYTEYPGVKHNSWENVSKEQTLIEWLFSQKKNNIK